MEGLKLFVWEGVFTDNTDGLAVALAHNVEEARELIYEAHKKRFLGLCCPSWKEELAAEPQVVESPAAFFVHGGG